MLAILAISPLMVHAQVSSPAQPKSTPVLVSKNTQPATPAGATSDSDVAPAKVRVSTGVTPPTLIYSVDVNPHRILDDNSGRDRTVTVDMMVDASGKPIDLKVVKSADKFTDGGVLAAVSQYRYKPASLDGTAVPIGVTVNFKIQ
jgi:TonB family protein